MKTISKEVLKNWTKECEEFGKQIGHPIKIISRKWNTVKTILAIVGIILTLVITIQFTVVGAELMPMIQNNVSSSIITIKVIHEVGLTQDMKDYIENKTPEIWNAIKQELGK